MGVILILIGLFHIIFPKAAWFMEIGWKIKDGEPSDFYLIFSRAIGVILCIVGIFQF